MSTDSVASGVALGETSHCRCWDFEEDDVAALGHSRRPVSIYTDSLAVQDVPTGYPIAGLVLEFGQQ